jgi:hypothetical protein
MIVPFLAASARSIASRTNSHYRKRLGTEDTNSFTCILSPRLRGECRKTIGPHTRYPCGCRVEPAHIRDSLCRVYSALFPVRSGIGVPTAVLASSLEGFTRESHLARWPSSWLWTILPAKLSQYLTTGDTRRNRTWRTGQPVH